MAVGAAPAAAGTSSASAGAWPVSARGVGGSPSAPEVDARGVRAAGSASLGSRSLRIGGKRNPVRALKPGTARCEPLESFSPPGAPLSDSLAESAACRPLVLPEVCELSERAGEPVRPTKLRSLCTARRSG